MLTDEALKQFKEHVLAEYPKEAVGVLIGDKYYPCTNAHSQPELHFCLDGKERYQKEAKYGPIRAILHSHPYKLSESKHFYTEKYNPCWPSVDDQNSYLNDDVPWGIIATDGEGFSELIWLTDNLPLAKRQFAWFTADCYACIRDWHRDNTGIVLPNFTREWQFWKKGINTIEDGIATIPFATKHPADQAQIGDVAVFAVGGSEVINHLGVITGGNDFTHQFVEHYVITTGWNLWRPKAKYVVRFKDKNAS
jgi:proteasome lid subunit RPN8/RPN11